MQIEKAVRAQVHAGMINQSMALEVRVSGIGKDTAFGKIIEAEERADELRAQVQKTADQLSGYLVYIALTCAVLTLIISIALSGISARLAPARSPSAFTHLSPSKASATVSRF